MAIDISRGTVLESNIAFREFMSKIEFLSVTYAVCLHIILELNDTFVAVSVKPGLGTSGQEVQIIVTHLSQDLGISPNGADEGRHLLENVLIECSAFDKEDDFQYRLRNLRDPPVRVPNQTPSLSESLDLARRAANNVHNPM